MKIILEALNKQPVKFTKRYMEIYNKSLIGELLKVKESVISKKKIWYYVARCHINNDTRVIST